MLYSLTDAVPARLGQNPVAHRRHFRYGALSLPASSAGAGKAIMFLAAIALSGCSAPRAAWHSFNAGLGRSELVEMRCELIAPGIIGMPLVREVSFARPIHVPPEAARAIRHASSITGTSADYLAATAFRESSFRTSASARTSSAQGMYQFIEETWLATFARDGECIGEGALARHIVRMPNGSHTVANQLVRKRILDLRNNPFVASVFAARLAQRNAQVLMRYLGRQPTAGEVYVAHFLGAAAGLKLIELVQRSPWEPARTHFPRAAAANQPIFFSNGREKSAHEVWTGLIEQHERTRFML